MRQMYKYQYTGITSIPIVAINTIQTILIVWSCSVLLTARMMYKGIKAKVNKIVNM